MLFLHLTSPHRGEVRDSRKMSLVRKVRITTFKINKDFQYQGIFLLVRTPLRNAMSQPKGSFNTHAGHNSHKHHCLMLKPAHRIERGRKNAPWFLGQIPVFSE